MLLDSAAGLPLFTAAAGTTSDPPVPVAQPAVPVTPEQKLEFVAHKRKRQPESLVSHPTDKASSFACTHAPSGKKEEELADLAALQCSRICIRGISTSGPSKLVHIQPRRQPGRENDTQKPSNGKEEELADLTALQFPRFSIRNISSSGPSKLVHIQPRRQPGTENEAGRSARLPQREEKMPELHKRKWEVMERGGLTVAPMQQPMCQ